MVSSAKATTLLPTAPRITWLEIAMTAAGLFCVSTSVKSTIPILQQTDCDNLLADFSPTITVFSDFYAAKRSNRYIFTKMQSHFIRNTSNFHNLQWILQSGRFDCPWPNSDGGIRRTVRGGKSSGSEKQSET